MNDGDAAAARKERTFVPVLPTDAVVGAFADTQDFEDLALTSRLPSPLRLENYPISDLAHNHRQTSLKWRLFSNAWYRFGMDSIRMAANVQELWAKGAALSAQLPSPIPLVDERSYLEWPTEPT
jgi:hypothetical protein